MTDETFTTEPALLWREKAEAVDPEEGSLDVGLPDQVEVGFRGLGQRLDEEQASVVDQPVQPAERLGGLGDAGPAWLPRRTVWTTRPVPPPHRLQPSAQPPRPRRDR